VTSRGVRLVQGSSARLLWWGRRAGETRLGARGGALVYDALAHKAARELVRLKGVQAVWVTGSVAEGAPAPGWSDIDLLLETDAQSLEDELDLRAALRRWLERAPRWIRHLDYAPPDALDAVMRHGDAWAMQAQRTARLLVGDARPWPAAGHDADLRRLLGVAKVVERYAKTAPLIATAEGRVARQAARRLWRAVAALGTSAPPSPPASSTHRLLEDATAALEAKVRKVCEGWSAAPVASPPHDVPPVDGGVRSLIAGHGGALRALRWRSTTDAWLWIHPRPLGTPRACARLRALLGGELLLLTPQLASVAVLLDPAPLVRAGVAVVGEPAADVRAPPPSVARALAEVSLARLGLQARGRHLRVSVDKASALRRLAADVLLRGPALEAVAAGHEAPAPTPLPPSVGTERELIAALRDGVARRYGGTAPGAAR
jgi:predicted nucleotidyltransferase